MKENVWAKTLLSCYRYIERVCGAIDKVVEKKAVGSFYVCSSNFAKSSIFNIADGIISLSEKKKKLINVKVLVCDCLKKCQKLNAQLLIERYIEGDKSNEIALRHDLPMRSYFRKLSAAEKEFSSQMALLGYTERKLSEYLSSVGWIMNVYCQISQSNDEVVKFDEARLKKLALI